MASTHPLRFSREAVAAMESHARQEAPRECCGALLGGGDEVRVALCLANAAGDPLRTFELSAADLLRAEREAEALGGVVLGYFHSHPGGPSLPSAADAAHAWAGRVAVILAPGDDGRFRPRAFDFDEATRTFRERPVQSSGQ